MFLINGVIDPDRVVGDAVRNRRRGGPGGRLLSLAMLGLLSWAPASTPAGDEAAARPAAHEVAAPQPQPVVLPRVLFYFPFLPVPGVPSQFLPAPPSPYIWPLPVLVVLPAQPAPTTGGAKTEASAPAAQEKAAQVEADQVEAAQVEAEAKPPTPPQAAMPPAATPTVAPPVSGGVPSQVVAPALAVPQAKTSPTSPTPSGPSTNPAGKAKAAPAESKTKAAAPLVKKKPRTRKLCWKDGRLDVCK